MNNTSPQHLKIYTAKAQADKAINSLKGILHGINLDQTVNEKEITELHKWVLAHNELIDRNPFREFMTIIEQTISNKIPRKETIEDLHWLCQKYENDNYFYNAVTADLQVLQGLCHGIIADGTINEKEVFALNTWLEQNEHLNTYYPYDEIRSLLLSIVADNKVDEDEIAVLKAYFNQFVKLHDETTNAQLKNETTDITISALCSSEPNVIFKDKNFCITGVLKRGNREDLQTAIKKLGGTFTQGINKKTDYLIVGDNGNPAWAFACYGRKVEKALSMRKEGCTIMLIHEFDFADIVDDLIL